MISRNIITDAILVVVLVIVQIFLLNRLVIFGEYTPILFPIYVMFYPFYRNSFVFLGTSFLLGLGIDMFWGTWGINAMATSFIAFIRTLLFRTSTESTSDFLSFQTMQWSQFLGFIFINLFVHQLLVQFTEYFSLDRTLEIFIDVAITTAYSFVFVLFYVLIFKIKQKV